MIDLSGRFTSKSFKSSFVRDLTAPSFKPFRLRSHLLSMALHAPDKRLPTLESMNHQIDRGDLPLRLELIIPRPIDVDQFLLDQVQILNPASLDQNLIKPQRRDAEALRGPSAPS